MAKRSRTHAQQVAYEANKAHAIELYTTLNGEITEKELAQLVGVSRGAISQYLTEWLTSTRKK